MTDIVSRLQVPHLSGFEASKQSIKTRGILQSIRLFLAGLHDRARSLVNLPAAYLKVAGTPGSNSFMELAEEDLHQYFAKHPSKYAVRLTPAPLSHHTILRHSLAGLHDHVIHRPHI